jgi:hypothetical protein
MNYEPIETEGNPNYYIREESDKYDSYTQSQSVDKNEIVVCQSSSDVTVGPTGDYVPYLYNLPSYFNILKEANLSIAKAHNPDVRKHTEEFIAVLQRVLLKVRNSINTSSNLPPLKFRLLEDDSVLIEWIFKDFRIGFSFEPNSDDSGWYLVSNDNLNEVSTSGPLKDELLEPLFVNLLTFALSNS